MAYKVKQSSIPEVLIINSPVFEDNRGYFFESFNKKDFCSSTNLDIEFVQDNCSYSKKGVLRGLHFQKPKPQGKLIRVISGEIYDVAVDIRKNSDNFGKWFGIELSSINNTQLWIPEGFAHGFQVISDDALVSYKTTDYWDPKCEKAIKWNDPILNIQWPLQDRVIINTKDASAQKLSEIII
jgi:dTDP-4-dehydrorhamnose 3,5-epimerase